MNTEKCANLRFDGVCEAAPRPKWAISIGEIVLWDSMKSGKPTHATRIMDAFDGQRYTCDAVGRPSEQQECDTYTPRR